MGEPRAIISPEIRGELVPLTDEELCQLEENILRDGVREPLVVWRERGVLLDGHNRLEIAQKHGLSYETVEVSCTDDRAAREWVIRNQFGRRNISAYTRAELALRLKPLLAAQAKMSQGTRQISTSR